MIYYTVVLPMKVKTKIYIYIFILKKEMWSDLFVIHYKHTTQSLIRSVVIQGRCTIIHTGCYTARCTPPYKLQQ